MAFHFPRFQEPFDRVEWLQNECDISWIVIQNVARFGQFGSHWQENGRQLLIDYGSSGISLIFFNIVEWYTWWWSCWHQINDMDIVGHHSRNIWMITTKHFLLMNEECQHRIRQRDQGAKKIEFKFFFQDIYIKLGNFNYFTPSSFGGSEWLYIALNNNTSIRTNLIIFWRS